MIAAVPAVGHFSWTSRDRGNKGFPETSVALFRVTEHREPHFAGPHRVPRASHYLPARAARARAAAPPFMSQSGLLALCHLRPHQSPQAPNSSPHSSSCPTRSSHHRFLAIYSPSALHTPQNCTQHLLAKGKIHPGVTKDPEPFRALQTRGTRLRVPRELSDISQTHVPLPDLLPPRSPLPLLPPRGGAHCSLEGPVL